MPKHVDNIVLTSGAGVKLMPLIYVQEEAALSLIAAATGRLLILRDRELLIWSKQFSGYGQRFLMDCRSYRLFL